MANPFYVSPLGGLNVGQSIQNMGNQWQQNEIMDMRRTQFEQGQQDREAAMQAQEAQAAKQAMLKDLGTKAMQGDLTASQQLWVEAPEYAAQIDKGLGIQNDQQKQQVGGWLEKYLTTPADQRDAFLQKTASQTPFSIDDDLLAMDPAQRDGYANMLAGRYLNKDQISMLQGGGESPEYSNIKRGEDGNLYGLNKQTQQMERIKTPEGVTFGGDSGQTINVNTGANEQAKVIDKYQGEAFVGAQKAASDARKQMQNLNSLDALSEKAFSGSGAELKKGLGKLASAFGINVKGLSETELFESVANELTLGKTSMMTGVLTDRDMEFLQSTVPQLTQTADGRKKLIKIAKKMAQRQIEYAKEAAKFRRENGGVFNQFDFEQYLTEKNEGKDFLADFYPTDEAGVTDFQNLSDEELMQRAFGTGGN